MFGRGMKRCHGLDYWQVEVVGVRRQTAVVRVHSRVTEYVAGRRTGRDRHNANCSALVGPFRIAARPEDIERTVHCAHN